MKKKKLLIPLAIMSLSCGLAIGALTGCGGGEHEHNYTKWDYDESGHWQICEEDNEKSEKKPHSFGTDDRCECGAEKPALSTASGQVKLLKLGQFVTDFTGVTIDTGDDDGNEVDYNAQTGAFSITNLQVGKSYTLSISKAGYSTYTTPLEVVKGENTAVGGTKGCVLQYDAFTHGMHVGEDWTGNYGTPGKIDKSHVNDAENPYFTIGEGAGDFYVYSKDSYDTVTASVVYKDGLTWGVNDSERGNQGIRLVFEDGKASMIRIEKLADGKFKAQWIGGTNFDWEEQPILGDWDFGSDEAHYNPFSADVEAKYKDTGIELKLVRNGSAVYAYVNGEKMGEQMLPAEYATQKCRVALAAGHVIGGQKIPFSISETLPATVFDSALTLEKGTLPQGVEVSLDKTEGYKRGDLVTLSVNLTGEAAITALTYNNKSILDQYADGKVSFVLTEATNAISVTVEEKQYVNLTDVAVTGKKYDVKGSSLKDGTAITLQGQGGLADVELTVTGGKVSKENVARGAYTVLADGYKPAEIVIGADGLPNGITLEYDGFEMLPPNYDEGITDFSQVNEGVIKVNGWGGQSLDIVTKDTFTDVAVAINVKDSVAGVVQGIVLKFEDGKYVLLNFKKDQTLIQYRPECWGMQSVFGDTWIEHAITSADIEAFNSADGVDLALVRKGGMLYAFVGNRCIAADALPEGYETMKTQVGFFAWDVKANASWQFEITQTLPELTGTAELTKELPEVEGIAATLDKTAYTLGDELNLSVTLPEGYLISELTVNGVSYLEQFKNGKLTFLASTPEIAVSVKVIAGEYADIEANVTGKKYDVKGNSLEGKEITLVGQGGIGTVKLTVTDGKIAKKNVVQGIYAVEAEGYKPVNVTVGANGIAEAITLEYDGFGMLPPNWDAQIMDFSQVNDGIIKANGNGAQSLDIVTKDIFTDVAVTINVKDSVAGVVQGIVLKFENDKYVLLNFKKDQTLIQYRNEWGGMNSVFGDTWVEHAITNADIEVFNSANGIDLKLVRKGGMLYAFLGDRFIAADALPEGYETMKAQVGFFAFDVKANASWEFDITQTLPDLASAVKLTNNIPAGAEGVTATVDKTACTLGDKVTLTVTLPANYLVSDLTVNGVSCLDQFKDGKLTFTAMKAENTVVVTVSERQYANVEVEVKGKKYDVTGQYSLADGTTVTLKGQGGLADITFEVTGGKIAKDNVEQGKYTVEVEGYRPVEVTVGANGIATAIVLEYDDAFDLVKGWGSKNLDRQNDGELKVGNEMETLLTKALYNDVSFTMYLSGAYGDNKINGGNQGIAFRFDGGGYVLLRMEGKQKIQFAEPEWWQDGSKADGAGWKDLIFFKDGDEYLRAYAEGTLKLTLVRDGVTFYAFLNDRCIGYQTVDAKYETVGAQVGIYWAGTTNGAEKTWKYEMSETLPDLTATVTSGTTENGKVEGIPAQAGKLGDEVTLTLTPDSGYILKSLTIGGKAVDVLNSITYDKATKVGTYKFNIPLNTTAVVAEYALGTYGNVDTAISGIKYGETEAIALNGTSVKLVGVLADYEATIAEGKLTIANVIAGTYTLTAEGCIPTTVTVTENGIEGDIKLVVNIFTSAPASADLSKLGEGKVTATGNGGVDLEIKEKYTNVTVEATFTVPDYNGRRYGIALVFDDGKNFRVDFAVQDGGNNILQQTNWNSMMFNWEWVDFPEGYFAERDNNYTEAEIRSEFIAKGLTYKLERDGATVKLYINGVLMKTYTLPENYANQAAKLKFIFDSNGTDGTKGFTFDITVPAEGGEN